MMTRNPTRLPTHPGALLREVIIPASGETMTDLAAALGVSRQSLHEIVRERRPVTPLMALRLAKAFGNSPLFWLNMQARHDLAVQAVTRADAIEEVRTLKAA